MSSANDNSQNTAGSSKKRYDYSEINKRHRFLLWLKRIHYRYPYAWIMFSTLVLVGCMYHGAAVVYVKSLYMDPAEFEEYKRIEREKELLRSRYGEGLRLPFSKRTFNFFDEDDVRLLKQRHQRDKDKEERRLVEAPASEYR